MVTGFEGLHGLSVSLMISSNSSLSSDDETNRLVNMGLLDTLEPLA